MTLMIVFQRVNGTGCYPVDTETLESGLVAAQQIPIANRATHIKAGASGFVVIV